MEQTSSGAQHLLVASLEKHGRSLSSLDPSGKKQVPAVVVLRGKTKAARYIAIRSNIEVALRITGETGRFTDFQR